MTRLTAAALAVAAAAFLPATPASAVHNCDKYGDKPCFLVCEEFNEWWDGVVAPLLMDPPPKPICT